MANSNLCIGYNLIMQTFVFFDIKHEALIQKNGQSLDDFLETANAYMEKLGIPLQRPESCFSSDYPLEYVGGWVRLSKFGECKLVYYHLESGMRAQLFYSLSEGVYYSPLSETTNEKEARKELFQYMDNMRLRVLLK